MSLTSKKLLIFTLSITILVILVLYDPRSSIIAEPFDLTKAALSIAISYFLYIKICFSFGKLKSKFDLGKDLRFKNRKIFI